MVSRPVRTFLRKVGKTIDNFEWEIAQKDLLLKAQKAQIEGLNKRKKKRQIIDCNEMFANIETIKQAREAMEAMEAIPRTRRATQRPATSENTRNTVINDPQSAYMHVFSIHPIVADD
jgi:NAD/NADP transhydrogenase alpha subunit